ncbi:deoxyribodipyrimidine photo-lyase [Algimonas arctica]|uniref:Deoxyribodipyrimidine photo-lyase n=1 Tax=Algimonas arctica TaxID=1479486 RepID=A0A8J3CP67_9PROT|nr:deoxyribodipyrimidine photo-lyase [Algimonas arctica]GHA90001.1 deoxyribodipyrimidine photo-lyase [Algimonas arctica]
MTTASPSIVWFRKDRRLSDHPALHAAIDRGGPIILLYILESDTGRAHGGANGVWLHHSLGELKADIENRGGRLILRAGAAAAVIDAVIKETGADAVFWNRRYFKPDRDRDAQIKDTLTARGLSVESFKGNLLVEPWEVKTKTGTPYRVFTPFWRAAKDGLEVADPLPAPTTLDGFDGALASDDLDGWGLLPTRPDWGSKMLDYHTPGEAAAQARLADFLDGPIEDYAEGRDRPDKDLTSRLSPHLAHGEISPRQIWDACKDNETTSYKFLSEIGWREFSYSLLFYNPELATKNFNPNYEAMAWDHDDQAFEAWTTGQTGYPFVDAGMRQLWATGWMHNRVRMVVASFLIKHLMIDWRDGEDWFWDTLLEADLASNAASWQWVAGTGADAAPYFRVFNPFGQGEKFDPNGDYVRQWVPELAALPNKYLQQPWTAPDDVLDKSGIELGRDYPEPIVDHKEARERVLAAYKAARAGN